ncbi:IclR family transcriptional regulator [Roseateles amylovorans]|uniref:IclR family transcriptional regulator n=1 Tax=Roseateles amylovorans TaxID=2978473 RepID=A0ABY6AY59_9BURK|nr:IclR family transcriptional regulator [Roseateles amylovorans]UXH77233.1 IclR family transcriptional regulator [Roseateles amylovorans]
MSHDDPSDPTGDDRRGIQSIEVGGRLLKAAAARGQPMPLKALSQAADMTPAKAHPYLVSFCKLGLMNQDPATGYYRLGPLALEMGLIGLRQIDPIREATAMLEDLAQDIGHTVAIAVWGSQGATIVRTADSPAAVHVTMRHGTVVSLFDTASGPLFAAHRPVAEVKTLLTDARQRGPMDLARVGRHDRRRAVPSWAEFARQLAEIRERGMHRSVGGIVEGVSALAVPVFDGDGQMTIALTAIGPSGAFDSEWEGEVAQRLSRAAAELMQRIGGRAPG